MTETRERGGRGRRMPSRAIDSIVYFVQARQRKYPSSRVQHGMFGTTFYTAVYYQIYL